MSASALLIDSSVWIARVFDAHRGHSAASAALKAATAPRPAVFCRATEQSFLRLASTPALLRIYGAAGMTNVDALELLNRFRGLATVAFREEPAGLAPLWHRLAARPSASPKLWMDAFLAAFAIAGGLQLVTLDRDFKSFERAGLDLVVLEGK